MNVVGYTRVSSREQELEGLSLSAQQRRLAAECEHRDDCTLAAMIVEAKSARRHRPQFELLLNQLDAGRYDALMVTRLDRIARSTAQFALMLDRSEKHGWKVIMLDPNVDTTTAYGRAFAEMGAVFARLEVALISQRTKEGLAEARAQGTFRPGEHLRFTDTDVIDQIITWRGTGLSYRAIAARLDRQGTPAPRGTDWHPRTIGRILARNQEGQDS